jgi:alpha-beta hydrolase superfamily lysophospholipase
VNTTGQRAEQAGARPTIVLVHGAFADASSWNGVIERLQQQGYTADHIVKAAQAAVGSGR